MCNCGKNNCGGCSNNDASLAAQVADLQSMVDEISESSKFLRCGHPILLIEDVDDIAMFNMTTGEGFDCWEGWAICDGRSHYSAKLKKNIPTPNFVDRFVVMALGAYAVGDTGGANTVTLDISEMPAHNHDVTDPGHTHAVTDPGHVHAISDDQHTHAFTGGTHTHTGTTDTAGGHEHTTGSVIIGFSGTDGAVRLDDGNAGNSTSTNGEHQHGFTTDEAAVSGTVAMAATGIEIVSALTGISVDSNVTGITTENEGGGGAHENRPPYYAAIYIKKIF